MFLHYFIREKLIQLIVYALENEVCVYYILNFSFNFCTP